MPRPVSAAAAGHMARARHMSRRVRRARAEAGACSLDTGARPGDARRRIGAMTRIWLALEGTHADPVEDGLRPRDPRSRRPAPRARRAARGRSRRDLRRSRARHLGGAGRRPELLVSPLRVRGGVHGAFGLSRRRGTPRPARGIHRAARAIRGGASEQGGVDAACDGDRELARRLGARPPSVRSPARGARETDGPQRCRREGAMKRTNVRNERLVALFLFGLLLFNYPLLAMFNSATLVAGVPKLYLYLFVAWAAVIAGLILRLTAREDGDGRGDLSRGAGTMPPR